jgi:hypothetical protein
VLFIVQLLPQYSIGLQPDRYLKLALKQPFFGTAQVATPSKLAENLKFTSFKAVFGTPIGLQANEISREKLLNMQHLPNPKCSQVLGYCVTSSRQARKSK